MSNSEFVRQGELDSYSSHEKFTQLLNQAPPANAIEKTPDGRAVTMTISHIEATLDEVFLGQWSIENTQIQQIANEVLMILELLVVHPISGMHIRRTGCAAIQITMDAVPENIKSNSQAKNAWALDMSHKKPNALYLSFPKLKALALKNAAQSFGTLFGRNLNRKNEDQPEEFYGNMVAIEEALQVALTEVENAANIEELKAIWEGYNQLHNNTSFKAAVNSKKSILAYAAG